MEALNILPAPLGGLRIVFARIQPNTIAIFPGGHAQVEVNSRIPVFLMLTGVSLRKERMRPILEMAIHIPVHRPLMIPHV